MIPSARVPALRSQKAAIVGPAQRPASQARAIAAAAMPAATPVWASTSSGRPRLVATAPIRLAPTRRAARLRAAQPVAAGEDEGEQPGRPGKVALPDVVARTILHRGMENARDLRLLLEPARDPEPVLLVPPEPDVERPQAPERQPGIVGPGGLAEHPARLLEPRRDRFGRGHRAEHQIGMAADIFGAGGGRENHD